MGVTVPITSDPKPKKPWGVKRIFWWVFKLALGLVLLVHLYVLALRFVPVPSTILMMQRSISGETIQRDWTKLSDISPHVVEAVMGGEDGRFCQHNGIDWEAIEKALEDNAEGGRRRGGSTITQQTAKNVFFWNGGGYVRKAGEAYFALLIDFVWGKSRVMEVYLNVAEWGDGIFGVEAAAQAWFGKAAKDLTRRESALLAAVLPSPNKWRLDPPGPYVLKRASTLQQRMAVIRNSGYTSCVEGMTAVETQPAPQPVTSEELPQEITPNLAPETVGEESPQTTLNEIDTDPVTEPNPVPQDEF